MNDSENGWTLQAFKEHVEDLISIQNKEIDKLREKIASLESSILSRFGEQSGRQSAWPMMITIGSMVLSALSIALAFVMMLKR